MLKSTCLERALSTGPVCAMSCSTQTNVSSCSHPVTITLGFYGAAAAAAADVRDVGAYGAFSGLETGYLLCF